MANAVRVQVPLPALRKTRRNQKFRWVFYFPAALKKCRASFLPCGRTKIMKYRREGYNLKSGPNLYFFNTHANKFSVAYLLAILEQEGLKDSFGISFFGGYEDVERIMLGENFAVPAGVFIFSFMTPLLPELVDIIARMKEKPEYIKNKNRILMIAGGPHPSGDPDSAAAMGFDLVFSGEAEYMWPEFLQKVRGEGGSEKFGENIISEYSTSVIFDEREAPLDKYLPFGSLTAHIPPLEIMRGCYYKCRFCQTACSRVRFRSVESATRYFQEYKRRDIKKYLSYALRRFITCPRTSVKSILTRSRAF